MPLPQEWENVDWRPSVVLLPERTEGIRTLPLNRDKYPQFPRGYFMMATRDGDGPLIYYNAADIGGAGALVSQFVFWHEMGHFHLGHIDGIAAPKLDGVSPAFGNTFTPNKETDADAFAYRYWIKQHSLHGIQVIESVIQYFTDMGNAEGDAEHPSPKLRRDLLKLLLDETPCQIVVHNDDTTNPEFVHEVLGEYFKMPRDKAGAFIKEVEEKGKASIKQIWHASFGRALQSPTSITKQKAEFMVFDIMLKAKLSGNFKFRLESQCL